MVVLEESAVAQKVMLGPESNELSSASSHPGLLPARKM